MYGKCQIHHNYHCITLPLLHCLRTACLHCTAPTWFFACFPPCAQFAKIDSRSFCLWSFSSLPLPITLISISIANFIFQMLCVSTRLAQFACTFTLPRTVKSIGFNHLWSDLLTPKTESQHIIKLFTSFPQKSKHDNEFIMPAPKRICADCVVKIPINQFFVLLFFCNEKKKPQLGDLFV